MARKNVVRVIERENFVKSRQDKKAKVTYKNGVQFGPAGIEGCGKSECKLPFRHGHSVAILRPKVFKFAVQLQARFDDKALAAIEPQIFDMFQGE